MGIVFCLRFELKIWKIWQYYRRCIQNPGNFRTGIRTQQCSEIEVFSLPFGNCIPNKLSSFVVNTECNNRKGEGVDMYTEVITETLLSSILHICYKLHLQTNLTTTVQPIRVIAQV